MYLYPPGPITIVFVAYPIGVINEALAPKHIAIKNGLGSTPNVAANWIAMGVSITAVALLDTTSASRLVAK